MINTYQMGVEITELVKELLPNLLSEVGATQPKKILFSHYLARLNETRPLVLVAFSGSDHEEEAECQIAYQPSFEILAIVQGNSEEKTLKDIHAYHDALIDIFAKHHDTDSLYDIDIEDLGIYPSGNVNEKLCTIRVQGTAFISTDEEN